MTWEERKIFFDFSEAYKAIYTLCVHKSVRLPQSGRITHMTLKREGMVTVKIVNSQTGAAEECDYSCDFMAAALIMYCRTCDIPLPKRGAKVMDIAGEMIILRITIGSAGRPAIPDMVTP